MISVTWRVIRPDMREEAARILRVAEAHQGRSRRMSKVIRPDMREEAAGILRVAEAHQGRSRRMSKVVGPDT
jgi:hypothetical protein